MGEGVEALEDNLGRRVFDDHNRPGTDLLCPLDDDVCPPKSGVVKEVQDFLSLHSVGKR